MTHSVSDPKLRNSTVSAFWFTLILVILLISALNFVHNYSQHLNEAAHHHEAVEAAHTGTHEAATTTATAPAEDSYSNEAAAATTTPATTDSGNTGSTSGEQH